MKPVKKKPLVSKKPLDINHPGKHVRWKNYYLLAVILTVSFIAYLPVLKNELLGWDDDYYIRNNPLVHTINLKNIFSEFVMGNYHPLTIFFLSIEYHFFGLNETGYHTANLILHLFNTALVYYVITLISKRNAIALITALLFGIHPLHVESVAWAAELKDLLYTFFFLVSYIFYLKYLKELQNKFYLIALFLFLLSLLSKAMAASFPALLILTDYFLGRKVNRKSVLEKVPFILLSITFGVIAIIAQKSAGATDVIDFGPFDRILFACYGFINYFFKLILPLNLSAYYPYPVKSGVSIALEYYLYIVLVVAIITLTLYTLRYTKKIIFGLGFFTITVFLVLQLLPIGGAVMADRYSYIPSIGIFYLAGEGLLYLWNRKLKGAVIFILCLLTVFYSYKTYTRCKVWENGMILWNDVIKQYQTVPIAYHSRGMLLEKEQKYKEALRDYDKVVELKPDYKEVYNNRANLLVKENRIEEALFNYNKVIEFQPELAKGYYNRGTLYMNQNKNQEALKDYSTAIKLEPDFIDAYINRGNILKKEKRYTESLEDFNTAINQKPGIALLYYNRGLLFNDEGKYKEAFNDYSKAIEINPGYTEAYINRANLSRDQNNIDQALMDYSKAIDLNPGLPIAYFNRGTLYMNQKNNDKAINDFSKAIEMNNNYAKAYYNRALVKFYSGNKDAACIDFTMALRLNYQPAQEVINKLCK